MKLKYSYPSLLFVLALTLLMSRVANALCIGNDYEQQMSSQSTFLPVVNFANAPSTIPPNQTLSLTAEAKVDIGKGGKSSFYWCADGGYLEKDPRFPNYNTVKFTAPASVGQTVKVGVQVGDGLGYMFNQVISVNVTSPSTNTCTATLVYDNQVATYPADTVVAGTVVTQQWRLKNESNCEANGYQLAVYPNNATHDGNPYHYQENSLTQNSFSIPQYERDYVTAVFYAPEEPGIYQLHFDIVADGKPLTPLPDGRLFSEFEVIANDNNTPPSTFGAVRGYIWPKEARTDGAQWRVAGFGNWHKNAEVEGGYTVMDYTFECKEILGWIAPTPTTISMLPGKPINASCDYRKSNPIAGPAGELTVTYNKDESKFYLDYGVNGYTDYMVIDYAFNGAHWTPAFKKSIRTIKQGKQPVAINGADDVNVMYFRLEATNTSTNETFTSDIVTVNYDAEPTVIVESPTTPELFSLGSETYLKEVELNWLKIVDSKYRDNVDYYEFRYATNNSFANANTLNIGNPATGSNIYEVISHKVRNLQDDNTYYFRIRAVNRVGTSSWSNTESIGINAQDFPYFVLSDFQPQDSATGIGKMPRLSWQAVDTDGDPLDFYVVYGTEPNNLHKLRAFQSDYEGQNWLDFTAEGKSPLPTNADIYWQVLLREQGRDSNYYGGEYIKSPLLRFKTVASGPDLAITNVELAGTIQPDSTVPFKITVTNQGNESLDRIRCIESVYIKNGSEHPFRSGHSCPKQFLAAGEAEIVDVNIRFASGIETSNGNVYDNVLIAGDSQIRFQFAIPDAQDMSSANDAKTYPVHYSSTGPVISFFQLYEWGQMYDSSEPFWVRMGKNLEVVVQAEDDMRIEELTLQYRLRQSDEWATALVQANDHSSLTPENYDLPIPTTISPTDEAQVRVILRDNDNQETIKTSEVFSIVSGQLEAVIEPLSPTYMVGTNLAYQITADAPNGLGKIEVTLVCDSLHHSIYTEIVENSTQPLTLANSYQWAIPNGSSYASSDCHLKLWAGDLRYNIREVTSSQFAIGHADSDGDGIPDDFDPDDDNDGLPDVYEAQYAFLNPNDPSDAAADEDGDERTNLDEYLQGTNPQVADTPPVTNAKIVDVVGCYEHTLILDEKGRVWAWGNNQLGRLGDGTTEDKTTPTLLSDLSGVEALDCGYRFTVALKEDGTVWTWGENRFGQLGIGSTTDQLVPVKVSSLANVKAIAAGAGHIVVLKEDGTVLAWGHNDAFQVGVSNTKKQLSPVLVNGLTGITAIAAGNNHSVALKNGEVWSWGSNSYGQFGNGTSNTKTSTPVKAYLTSVTKIAAGYSRTFAVKNDGTVWSWGYNNSNCVLGDGTGLDRSSPVQVINLTNVVDIAVGGDHVIALKQDASAWVWGSNSEGQYGNGTTSYSKTPVPSTTFTDVVEINAGGAHSIFLREDSSVWTTGANNRAQLGDDTTEYRSSPIKVVFEGIEDDPKDDDEPVLPIPNNGDGNGDGIPDSQQTNVVTLPSAAGNTYLTLAVEGCSAQNVKTKTETDAGGIPDGAYDFPQGLIEFELPACESATVTVYMHGVTDADNRTYRKYGPTTPGDNDTMDWYTLPATFGTAIVGGKTVATASFTLTDNQLGDDTGKDGLIVDIGGAAKPACLIYAVHDGGLNNSQFITINPTKYFEVRPLGDKHVAFDIEALAMNSKGDMYGSSGNDAKKGHPNGHLYQVNRSTGKVTSIGDICFNDTQGVKVCGMEVSALTFRPDNTLWGWAEGYGLITVNLSKPGESSLVYPSDILVEDITWNETGERLYGIAKKDLWRYDGTSLKTCTLSCEVEALESLPDDVRIAYGKPKGHDLLMYSCHNSQGVTIRALEADANTCNNVDEIRIYAPKYNDIEGIVWVCDISGN
ncbi:MAG TPA: hypothetical protein ENI48_10275 [Thioploca sp.]|nr:hypothetical protein [Thioploca sp.]